MKTYNTKRGTKPRSKLQHEVSMRNWRLGRLQGILNNLNSLTREVSCDLQTEIYIDKIGLVLQEDIKETYRRNRAKIIKNRDSR